MRSRRHSAAARAFLVILTGALLSSTTARIGGASAPLSPGLFLEYKVELFEGGRRSEDGFRLVVDDSLGSGHWRLDLTTGGGDRYRCLYAEGGDASPFARERFTDLLREEEEGWILLDTGALELLDGLAAMQGRLDGSEATGDSLFVLGGRGWPAAVHALSDSSEVVQRSESVAITKRTVSQGRAWVSPELPFGGWLRYDETRGTVKISEFGGRRFEGEESRSRELWTLVDFGHQ